MIAVFDASAAVKLVLDERGSDVAGLLWDEVDAAVAPTVMPVEVAAAIGAAARAGRLGARAASRAQRAWADVADSFDLRVVDAGLADAARAVAAREAVRGMDAIYLAVAIELRTAEAPAGLVSFDVKQRAAALAAGITVLPAWVGDEPRAP